MSQCRSFAGSLPPKQLPPGTLGQAARVAEGRGQEDDDGGVLRVPLCRARGAARPLLAV